jgi:hypothetical protein
LLDLFGVLVVDASLFAWWAALVELIELCVIACVSLCSAL